MNLRKKYIKEALIALVFLTILTVTLVFSLFHIDEINFELDIPFKLTINKTASIDNGKIKVTFLNVSEDSRCPEGVFCAWGGKVSVALRVVDSNKNVKDIFLTKTIIDENLALKEFGKYTIKLLEVDPQPENGKIIKSSDYTINIVVSKV